MKRLHHMLLALCLVLGLAACGKAPTWQAQYDLGVRYLSEGNYQEAIIAFTAAIEIEPKQEKLYVGLADAYIGLGDYEQARQVLQTAQEQLGQQQGILEKLAELDAEQEQPEESEGEAVSLEADGMSFRGQGLSVQANTSRSGTVTLSGLALQNSYTVNKSSSFQDEAEYDWQVFLYTADGDYSVGTSWWAFEPGKNENVSLDEMQHSLWSVDENGGDWIGDVAMSYTADSISWNFSIPEEYAFDFARVERYEVQIWEGEDITTKVYTTGIGG